MPRVASGPVKHPQKLLIKGLQFWFKGVTIEEMNQDRHSDSFADRVKQFIKAIPKGKVATYGQIAMMAGNPGGLYVFSILKEKRIVPNRCQVS
jgi:O6-methylguanine-DNA--protein-cysteine methyltransferase